MTIDTFLRTLSDFMPTILVLFITLGILWVSHTVLLGRHIKIGVERRMPRQLLMLVLTIASTIALVLSLPINDGSRNQIIALIGLLLSGVFAFSSTTIFANMMAGVMLRVTQPFVTGDYIRVEQYFGRVAERGLFDTEVQTEQRELIAIPNTFLIQHPVSVISADGVLISASLSLGYDVHHGTVESSLLDAAGTCGLQESFVHITELGNYAVSYKVSGLLKDVQGLITMRSQLYVAVLDALHGAGIEILSPTVMNQRAIATDRQVVPQSAPIELAPVQALAEDIVFDKAEQAVQKESETKQLLADIKDAEEDLKKADEQTKAALRVQLTQLKARLEFLQSDEADGSGSETER